jgi:ribosomal protein S18 acetylase RimI-like enzyme
MNPAKQTIMQLRHAETGVARNIWSLCQAAYALEATLLGVTDFPPLRRSVESIQASPTVFFGITEDDTLVAVAELAREPEVCVDTLVVAPGHFRRGLASALLSHLLALPRPHGLIADTGAANAPALALYRRHGFVERERMLSREGIPLVRLRHGPV